MLIRSARFSWPVLIALAVGLSSCRRPEWPASKPAAAPQPVAAVQPAPSPSAAPQATQPAGTTGILRQLSDGLAAMAAQAKPAVVFVAVSKTVAGGSGAMMPNMPDFFPRAEPQAPEHVQGVGSGFIIDQAKGYVLTNNHVVEGADEISIRLPTGRSSPAKVVGRDKNTDLAVVQLTAPDQVRSGLTALTFANSDDVRVGDLALALGAPFGLEASLSVGVISATGRGSLGITKIGDFVQTDAAINPGNSGGPLMDANGRVIGVNTAIFSQTGAYAGIGFAIPSNMARMVADRLIAKGKVDRGFLGASLQEITPELREGFKIPPGVEGAIVADVQEGGPAARAGLRPGDAVTAVNGRALRGESDLVNTVGLMEPNQRVELRFLRDGKEQTASVTLGAWPQTSAVAAAGRDTATPGEAATHTPGFGLALTPLTPELRERFGLTSEHGAFVAQVGTGSPSEQAGLSPGDAIVSVNGTPVASPDDAIRLLKGQARPMLRLERRGGYYFTVLEAPPAGQVSH